MICDNKATVKYVWPGRQVFYACLHHFTMARLQAKDLGFGLEMQEIKDTNPPECSGKMRVHKK